MEWYTGYTVIYTLKKNGGWLVVTNKRVFPATEWKVPSAGWERDPEAEVSRWATQPLLEGVEGTVETQKEGGCPLTYLQLLYTRPPPAPFYQWMFSGLHPFQALEADLTLKKREQEAFFKMSETSDCPNPSSPTKLSKFVPYQDAFNT